MDERILIFSLLLFILGVALTPMGKKKKKPTQKNSLLPASEIERLRPLPYPQNGFVDFYVPPHALPGKDPDEKYQLKAFGSTAVPSNMPLDIYEQYIRWEKEKDGIFDEAGKVRNLPPMSDPVPRHYPR